MAKPLEFEYVVRCEDPRAEYEKLLSAPPSEAALETLKRAEELYRKRTRARGASRDDSEPRR